MKCRTITEVLELAARMTPTERAEFDELLAGEEFSPAAWRRLFGEPVIVITGVPQTDSTTKG